MLLIRHHSILLPTLSILIIYFVIHVHGQTPSCPHENEAFTHCASSTCFEESCTDVHVHVLFEKPGRRPCSRDCRSGCRCKTGYFRNHGGRCVTELTCIHCGYNEDWVEGDGNDDWVEGDGNDDCDDGNDDDNADGNDDGNADGNHDGNHDIEDDDNRTEIMHSEEEEEAERQYSRSYEETCDDINDAIEEDGDDLFSRTSYLGDNNETVGFFPSCQCGKGYYRRLEDGLCVDRNSCLGCGPNEVYETCGSSTCWEYNCDEKDTPLRERLSIQCSEDCNQGCRCHFGYYRDATSGLCVSAQMCS